jgi:4-hydroxybenzoate polyprenyltransferase
MSYVSTIKSYVQLTRPQNASGSVLTYCIGYFLATRSISYDFLIGLLILLALHSLATVQNDVEDYEVDKANKRHSIIQDNSLTIANARFFVQALALTALAFAFLSPYRKLHLIAIVGLLLIAWLYNIQPFRFSKRPVLSIFTMGICYGALPFIYGYFVAKGSPTANYFSAFVLLWFLARISTAIMKDYKDARGDKIFHKDTFYLHYGNNVTAWVSIVSAALAYAGLLIVLALLLPNTAAVSLAFSLATILAFRNVFQRFYLLKTRNETQLNSIFHKGVLNHNQFEAAVLLCLILSSK